MAEEVDKPVRFRWLKLFVARFICSRWVGKLIGRVFNNRIPNGGLSFWTDSDAIGDVEKAYLFWGMYESAERRFVRTFLSDDTPVVELGAGIGVICAEVLRKVKPGTRVVSVEANGSLIPLLTKNTAMFDWPELRIVHAAIMSESGKEVSFGGGDSHLVNGIGHGSEMASQQKVTSLTLQDLLKTEIGGAAYQLIMDIEGAEAGIIYSGVETLSPCRQMIAELHQTTYQGREISPEDMLNDLSEIHGLDLVQRYGNVCFLRRRAAK
jgi:FkbM family methyltransferase